jgi:hypothetical protein
MKRVLVALFVSTLFASASFAQATRTWVSGVGDDANPCSRTAPCKTFAGAISKTASGGEIDVLDPGGFGGVTITKSMTIDATGVTGGVLVSGTSGVTVNALTTDTVVLRNLVILGLNTGTNGVNALQAAKLHLDHCTIRGFNTAAVAISTSQTMSVVIHNSDLSNNAGAGISVIPSAGAPVVNITVEDSVLSQNGSRGIVLSSGAIGTIHGCTISNNASDGILVQQPAGVTVANVFDCIINNNNNGINANSGSTRISRNQIFNNASGVAGSVLSAADNHVFGNGLNNTIIVGGSVGGNQ